ncbi:uncharacterized protein LOC122068290 [Macadamia integrifolia]|uniref:uncharacterized protein LOC122068290 n=1 Tax=Macadamia integrifolia TaxID=60698 RepID=UPI001C4F6096|nr:uncharacterized protein LOC122068290 [Macadamia integrifolia]XP_042488096.1 uncharacterized protein LOC122068290 [Macadamia integrifolia]
MSTLKQAVNETAKWSQANVDTLIVLMVEEVKKGNRTTSTFNKAGWNNIANNFKEKTGVNYAIVQLKNKVNKLRQDYSQFKKLLETTGFGWDTASRTCTVDDESIWESHIKKHRLPQWPELCMVFGDTYADREGSGTQTTVLETMGADDARNMIESCDESSSADEVTPLGDTQTEAVEKRPATKHRHDRTPNVKRRRNKSNDWSMACKAIQDMSKSRVERDASMSTASTQNAEQMYGITKAMEVLESGYELDETLYKKALLKLMANTQWREVLISCPPHRKSILLRTLQ